VYSPTLRQLRRRHRLPSREIRRQIPTRVRLCSDAFAWKSASAWHNSPTFFGVEPIAREDTRASVKKTTPRPASRRPGPSRSPAHYGKDLVSPVTRHASSHKQTPGVSVLINGKNCLSSRPSSANGAMKKRRRPGTTDDASHLHRTLEIVGRKVTETLRRRYAS
jgi:hypothetical protein